MRCLLDFAFQTDAKAWPQSEPTPHLASPIATSPPLGDCRIPRAMGAQSAPLYHPVRTSLRQHSGRSPEESRDH